jgi:hypothetical protein
MLPRVFGVSAIHDNDEANSVKTSSSSPTLLVPADRPLGFHRGRTSLQQSTGSFRPTIDDLALIGDRAKE